MSFFRNTLLELREKRLWPIVAALIVALIAIPVVLSSTSSNSDAPLTAGVTSTPSDSAVVPDVQTTTGPSTGKLTGAEHNPFGTKASVKGTTPTNTTSTTPGNTNAGAKGGGTTSTPTTSTTTTGSSGTPTTTTTTPTLPTKPVTKAPTGLTPEETYNVSIVSTTSDGGVNTTGPLTRLSVFPSANNPLLVELGVLKGGRRVLFAVQPGTVVSGPGACLPGRINCQLVSLAPGQTERLSQTNVAGGITVPVDLFAIAGITAAKHSSAAVAQKMRTKVSAVGQQLLANSTLSALPLFKYEPKVGALIDLRNLTVGGS